jgi:hypothetical protein
LHVLEPQRRGEALRVVGAPGEGEPVLDVVAAGVEKPRAEAQAAKMRPFSLGEAAAARPADPELPGATADVERVVAAGKPLIGWPRSSAMPTVAALSVEIPSSSSPGNAFTRN